MADELKACFSISDPEIKACYSVEEKKIDACFKLNILPSKISELENDMDYQTGEQVSESIAEASAIINERIDGVVEAFDSEIEDINERMIDTIEGNELIGVSREDNTVSLTSKTFVFEQGIPSTEWVINHNLNKRPSIDLVNTNGERFEAYREYTSNNQVIIRLDNANTGYAYLN